MEIGSTSSVNGAARNARRSLLVTDDASLRVKGLMRYSVYTHLLYHRQIRPGRSSPEQREMYLRASRSIAMAAHRPRRPRPQAYMNFVR